MFLLLVARVHDACCLSRLRHSICGCACLTRVAMRSSGHQWVRNEMRANLRMFAFTITLPTTAMLLLLCNFPPQNLTQISHISRGSSLKKPSGTTQCQR
ncbi:hypothetical protein GE21DRAFT_1095090 [Neurospora crassa]|nr:hypothetical protein GE21DRAFT_1095090 [Neurospora crassa]